jgi:hypothetical protein
MKKIIESLAISFFYLIGICGISASTTVDNIKDYVLFIDGFVMIAIGTYLHLLIKK